MTELLRNWRVVVRLKLRTEEKNMKRALLSAGAAMLLTAAAFVTTATDAAAQGSPGGMRGGNSGGGRAAVSRGGGGVSVYRGGGNNFSRGGMVRNGGGVNVARNFNGGGHFQHRRHFRGGPIIAVVPSAPYYSSYAYTDECVVPQRVLTEYGWRVVLVNVCDY
jgi:hypothetical protein